MTQKPELGRLTTRLTQKKSDKGGDERDWGTCVLLRRSSRGKKNRKKRNYLQSERR